MIKTIGLALDGPTSASHLKMTSLNIKVAFLNQPVEVSEVRRQFQKAIGLGDALPKLLVRFGYADPMPRSLRRSVRQVLM